ncbi:MAG: diguanylate cyclase [Scytonema sp. PMC 1069.18]|nr:diguanylate cyclase [Scytonema sp. PMC 1069.18]MEC4887533.1 diguanylate cyclase [Scytonema sp. PMC 1070.18]
MNNSFHTQFAEGFSNVLLLFSQDENILVIIIGAVFLLTGIFNLKTLKNVLPRLLNRNVNNVVGCIPGENCIKEMVKLVLKLANDELEVRVAKRTLELRESNERLQAELRNRQGVEEALQKANQELLYKVKELETRNHEIALLKKLCDFLQNCSTREEVYKAIAHFIEPIFPEISGGLLIMDTSADKVDISVTWGNLDWISQTSFGFFEHWVLRHERSQSVEFNFCGLGCIRMDESGRFTSLCIPMMVHGKALGLLYLYSFVEKPFTTAQQQLAYEVAEHIALALFNLQLREALRQQSISDPLTGLYNRRYLQEFLEQELLLAQRQQSCLGVIIADVDHFKHFNDTFGHEVGDVILRELGVLLKQQVRRSDIACRYGGEEFLLILPETPLELCAQRAEQICQQIRALDFHYHNQPIGFISVSIGVAIFPTHGSSVEAVIQAADVALYRAKQLGRNRVVIATPSQDTFSKST